MLSQTPRPFLYRDTDSRRLLSRSNSNGFVEKPTTEELATVGFTQLRIPDPPARESIEVLVACNPHMWDAERLQVLREIYESRFA